jgi:hypothetical protein
MCTTFTEIRFSDAYSLYTLILINLLGESGPTITRIQFTASERISLYPTQHET